MLGHLSKIDASKKICFKKISLPWRNRVYSVQKYTPFYTTVFDICMMYPALPDYTTFSTTIYDTCRIYPACPLRIYPLFQKIYIGLSGAPRIYSWYLEYAPRYTTTCHTSLIYPSSPKYTSFLTTISDILIIYLDPRINPILHSYLRKTHNAGGSWLQLYSTVKICRTLVPQNAIVPVGRPRPYSIIILNMRFIPNTALRTSSQIMASSYILQRLYEWIFPPKLKAFNSSGS